MKIFTRENQKDAEQYIGEEGFFSSDDGKKPIRGALWHVWPYGTMAYPNPFIPRNGTDSYEQFAPLRNNFHIELVGFGQENPHIKDGMKGVFAHSFAILRESVLRYWETKNRFVLHEVKVFLGNPHPYKLQDPVISNQYSFFYPIQGIPIYRPFTIGEIANLVGKEFKREDKHNDAVYELQHTSIEKDSIEMSFYCKGTEMSLYASSPQEFLDKFMFADGSPAGARVEE